MPLMASLALMLVVSIASPTPVPTRAIATPAASPTTAIATPTPVPAMAMATPTALSSQALDPPELRAVWADAFHDGFKSPEQVDALLAWARAANLNALFVQVRKRGDAYYLQSFEPPAEDLPPGFDALQYLIDRAHQGPRPLQVHAWLATLPIWHKRDIPPLAESHPFNVHGLNASGGENWLMQRDDGATWAGVGEEGTYYLDPGNPDAARYTASVYVNLVRHYPVDGVHLDQVRYYEGQPLRWGYNPTSVARFVAQFGRDLQSQPEPTDPDWIAWRRDQVTALVRRIYLEVKAIRPGIAVTAAVVTWGKGPQTANDWDAQPPFAAALQDWHAWLQEGIVDYLLPMDYYRESNEQAAWFDAWTRWQVTNTGKRGIAVGLGSYLNAADAGLAQLARARALGSLGVALYSYAVPTRDLENGSLDDRAAYAARLRTVFPRPAPVPDLAWMSHPSSGGVLVDIPGHEGVPVVLTDARGQQLAWLTDGTGLAGGVDVPTGGYVLTVTGQGIDPTPIELDVLAGRATAIRFAPGHASGSS
jgi:uncharacterized lipoprotein YddW (UPF0748 family)